MTGESESVPKKSKEFLVSVIIPVYQVSDYVERCLLSVMNQTYTYIECIIVDDCSPDDSIAKCERLIDSYEGPIKFKIHHHERNRGLSAARNTGTDAATGDYIFYFDSDDKISIECLERLVKAAQLHPECEMVLGNILVYEIDGKERIVIGNEIPLRLHKNETIVSYYHQQLIPIAAWNKLIKRSFINDNHINFKEGIIIEDYHWMFYVLKYLSDIIILKDITYHYYKREGSIMTGSGKQDYASSYYIIYDDILHHLTKGRKGQELTRYLAGFCNRYLKYKEIVPAYQELCDLYRRQAFKYDCSYAFFVLSMLNIIEQFENSHLFLERLNELKWKVKRGLWKIRNSYKKSA